MEWGRWRRPGEPVKTYPASEYPRFLVMSHPGLGDVVGRAAHVTIAIPGGERAGEVMLRVRGGSEAYIAFADEPIDIGAPVVVVSDRGARTLFVAPL